MSTQSSTTQARPVVRFFVLLALIIALVVALFSGSSSSETRFRPELALDLEGGTQIILTPIATDGSDVSSQDINQAIAIIRQRVDASGVAEAEITSQGGSNIVVGLPGQPSQETLDLVRTSAVLRMRPVLTTVSPLALDQSSVVAQFDNQNRELVAGSADSMTPEELDENIRALADVNQDGEISSEPAVTPTDPSDPNWVTEEMLYQSFIITCGTQEAALAGTASDPDTASVACDPLTNTKYILGPAEVEGAQIESASSGPAVNSQGVPTGGYAVSIQFTTDGDRAFTESTGRIYQLEAPRNQFAIVLDGQVISAPVPNGPISGGAQITGQFTAESAESLANQLNFGSLPLNFQVQSEEQISATLGTDQLRSGLIAGAIGLGLIVVYMIWQYHALGAVAVLSIVLSTGLSYLVICLLSWVMGYRLSMAGVLGMIISIGVTADSFIVYFERIRDEIRDGRTIPSAIQHGWERARQTIIVSDAVNLLASIILYMLTVGSVRGFAFTLGVTTVLDLIVVMMFTYPLMTWLGKRSFFGKGKAFSGLNWKKLEAPSVYRGRGDFGVKHEPKRTTGRSAFDAIEGRELSADELPDERFRTEPVNAGSGLKRREGESLAKLRARERRAAREAQRAEEGNA